MLLGPDLFSKDSGLRIVNKSWIFQQSGRVGEKTFVSGGLLRLALCVGFGNLLICSLQLAFNYRFLAAAAARVS